MSIKNKIGFFCLLTGMWLGSLALWSCSNDDDDLSGGTDGVSFGTATVGDVNFNFNYAYLSSANVNNGVEYTIYLSSHDMVALSAESTADPDIYIHDAYITVLSKDGSLPSGTYSYPNGGLVDFDLGGYYWAESWGDGDVAVGDREKYYYSVINSDIPSTIEVIVNDENLSINGTNIAVEDGETYDEVIYKANIFYNGKITSF